MIFLYEFDFFSTCTGSSSDSTLSAGAVIGIIAGILGGLCICVTIIVVIICCICKSASRPAMTIYPQTYQPPYAFQPGYAPYPVAESQPPSYSSVERKLDKPVVVPMEERQPVVVPMEERQLVVVPMEERQPPPPPYIEQYPVMESANETQPEQFNDGLRAEAKKI